MAINWRFQSNSLEFIKFWQFEILFFSWELYITIIFNYDNFIKRIKIIDALIILDRVIVSHGWDKSEYFINWDLKNILINYIYVNKICESGRRFL